MHVLAWVEYIATGGTFAKLPLAVLMDVLIMVGGMPLGPSP